MTLDSIVNVTITSQTQAIPEANFGIPMILGVSKSFTDIVRSYSNMTGVAVDFSPNQPEYIAAQEVFGQNPCPTNVLIGRRDCSTVQANVLTAEYAQEYSVTINSTTVNVNSSATQQACSIVWSADFVSDNLINVDLNGTALGTITSVIDFDINFVTSNSILAVVNDIALTPVVFTTDQATTIGLLATEIATASGVTSATVTATKEITVVFTNPGNNTVNSVTTTLGSTQPVATISQGGFVFTTDQATTIGLIVTAIEAVSGISSASATSDTIDVVSNAGILNEFTDVSVTLGSSQATAVVTNDSLNATIAKALVTAINGASLPVTATYVSSPDGSFSVVANVATTPYIFDVATNITVPNALLVEITQVVPNQNYLINLAGVNYQYFVTSAIQTTDQISLALVALINANSGNSGITATDHANGTFTCISEVPFSFFITQQVMAAEFGITVSPYVATDVVQTTLANIYEANTNWYALILTDRTVATVLAAAAWIQSEVLIFGTASADPNIINEAIGTDVTSIAYQLQNLGYTRTFCMYHQDAATDYPEAAWMGVVLPLTPGSETWKFKTLAGIAYSNLTTNQSINSLSKNCNTYQFVGGVGITQNGTMAQGEFIDIIRGIDWLQLTIQNYVYSSLVNSPKVPYTDAGIAVIQSQLQRAIQQGIDNNFITDNPAPIITVPLAANVSSVDKANRILRNVNFTVVLAGAIHMVQINGTVTV